MKKVYRNFNTKDAYKWEEPISCCDENNIRRVVLSMLKHITPRFIAQSIIDSTKNVEIVEQVIDFYENNL